MIDVIHKRCKTYTEIRDGTIKNINEEKNAKNVNTKCEEITCQ